VHRVNPVDYYLDCETLRARFMFYCERFGLSNC
jgi:hypothetical protein